MEIFLMILVVLALVVAGVVFSASRKPDMFRTQRSLAMKASPDKIAAHLTDYKKWAEWSPYEGVEGDDLKKEYSGAESGVGATYAWEGKKTGKGDMTTTEVTPGKILIDLHFDKPMKAHNTAFFTMEPAGETTNVTWGVEGKDTLATKVFCLFFDRDRLIGKDFEKGLANLKAIVER